jgi:hypothetical protein
MWTSSNIRAAILPVALALLAASCDRDTTAPTAATPQSAATSFRHGPDVRYTQRDFLGNPLVSEVTVPKAMHERYNKLAPFIRVEEFKQVTEQFVTGVAGRPAQVATTLSSVLYPDMLIVQTNRDPSTAGWLSWALADGWGGRKLTDDVVDAGLQAIFGPLLSPENVSAGLASDNVNANDKPFLASFPYYAEPTL